MNQTQTLALSGLVSGPAYPVDLVKRVRDRSGVDLGLAGIYTALNRLEDRGMVRSYFDEDGPRSRGGRRRKFFILTADGCKAADAVRQADGRDTVNGLLPPGVTHA